MPIHRTRSPGACPARRRTALFTVGASLDSPAAQSPLPLSRGMIATGNHEYFNSLREHHPLHKGGHDLRNRDMQPFNGTCGNHCLAGG